LAFDRSLKPAERALLASEPLYVRHRPMGSGQAGANRAHRDWSRISRIWQDICPDSCLAPGSGALVLSMKCFQFASNSGWMASITEVESNGFVFRTRN